MKRRPYFIGGFVIDRLYGAGTADSVPYREVSECPL